MQTVYTWFLLMGLFRYVILNNRAVQKEKMGWRKNIHEHNQCSHLSQPFIRYKRLASLVIYGASQPTVCSLLIIKLIWPGRTIVTCMQILVTTFCPDEALSAHLLSSHRHRLRPTSKFQTIEHQSTLSRQVFRIRASVGRTTCKCLGPQKKFETVFQLQNYLLQT